MCDFKFEGVKKNLKEHNSNKLIELLFYLNQKESMENIYGLNLPKDYNLDHINKRLIFLSQNL